MREAKGKEARRTMLNELHGICTSHEAGVIRRYIDYKLDELAQQALVCSKDDLDHVQGRARELRELEFNMMNGPKTPPGHTNS